MKKILKKIIKLILFKIDSQIFWEQIYRVALVQMNFGNGEKFELSGELNVAKLIKKKLDNNLITIFDVGANVGARFKNIFSRLLLFIASKLYYL